MTDMAEVLRALYAAAADDIPACSSCAADSTVEEIEPGIDPAPGDRASRRLPGAGRRAWRVRRVKTWCRPIHHRAAFTTRLAFMAATKARDRIVCTTEKAPRIELFQRHDTDGSGRYPIKLKEED